MSSQDTAPTESPEWAFLHFGLIVTGETEQEHLPKLFKSLRATGICHFEVIRKTEQRSPGTSRSQGPEVVGTNQMIERKDELEIGLPARGYINRSGCHFVLLIDDLEHRRRDQALEVFNLYRTILDTVLNTLKHRASMHFLVNMLEAYYFADARAINAVLETSLPDYEGDVETIRNPKSDLRAEYQGFREIDDGGRILDRINIEHVLFRPDTYASLRILFAWCVKVLETYSDYNCTGFYDKYKLRDGRLSEITRTQLANLGVTHFSSEH